MFSCQPVMVGSYNLDVKFNLSGIVIGSNHIPNKLQIRNKKSVISIDMSPKYRISTGNDTILLTKSWFSKISGKSPIFGRNIGKYQYFDEISSIYITRV